VRRRKSTTTRGFTLLEMMIAMAILAGSLTWLVVGMSRNISSENHAKLMTTATFLARGRMSQFEDDLYEKGFGEFDKEDSGTFGDKGFTRFGWRIVVDKVELPSSEQMQTVLSKAQEARQQLQGGNTDDKSGSTSGTNGANSGNPLSASANAMGSQFGMIKDVLEQGIRRVTVKVTWNEGRRPQDVTIMAYFTDPRKVDQAINLSPKLPGQ
jgi:prepilin-type N-terminal cleavage/methylation domain-containing protein